MERKRMGSAPGAFGTLMRSGAIGRLDDEELLDRFVARREEDAFSALVERHGPMVRRVCRSVLADEHDAGDAYQATFLILAKRARSIRCGGSLGPWLFGVARRVALKARKKEKRRRSVERDAASLRGIEAPSPPEYLPEVMEEVDRLPDRLRSAVILCDLQGKSYESAARMIGCPVRTVHSRLRTARDRLRRRLTRRGLAPGLAVGGSLFGSASTGSGAFCSAATSAAALSRVAVGVSVGNRVLAGAVSASVGSLTNWGIKVMLIEKAAMAGTACLILGGAIGFGPVLARVGFPGDGAGDGPPVVVAAIDGEVAGVPLPARDDQEPPELVQDPPAAAPEPASPIGTGSDSDVRPELPSPEEEQSPPPNIVQKPARDFLEPPLQEKEPVSIPRPWETVVRIKVKEGGATDFGSGTVIESTAEQSIILTAARLFTTRGPQPSPDPFTGTIEVDWFEGQNVQPSLNPLLGLTAELIARDFDRDLALIRIRPGQVVKWSPIVPVSWQLRTGMSMITAGCSHDNNLVVWSTLIIDPFWNTSIVDPSTKLGIAGDRDYEGILCRYSPKQGREDGGLFTTDGYLAGVFNFAFAPEVEKGIYASPDSIREFLAESRPKLLNRAAGEAPSERLVSSNEGPSVLPSPVEPPAVGESTIIPPRSTTYVLPTDIPQGQEVQPQTQPEDDRLDRIEQRLDELIAALASKDAGESGPTRPAARAVDFESYRPKLLELLKRGPIRLIFAEPFEATLLLKSAEDIERTESILRAMFGQGSPIIIEREPANDSPPSDPTPSRSRGSSADPFEPPSLSHDPFALPNHPSSPSPSPF